VVGDRDKNIIIRRRICIGGIVQGVGFRPFVFRLANELDLSGWVRNSPAGVEIELQGTADALAICERSLTDLAPPLAEITSRSAENIHIIDECGFAVLPSTDGERNIQVAPDSALCSDCLRELFDPADRRYRYPFITCTNCGPRYSIITGTPYDRPKTTMAAFPLCSDCQREYQDPADRRFHAQPIACPACGPQVRLVKASGEVGLEGDAAILQAIVLLKQGHILAIKGIGGYHLAVNACDDQAVRRLRKRKKRDEKPFAIMAADLATAHKLALLNEMEERLLTGPESPIVIVRRTSDCPVSALSAPGNDWLGLILPYAPLHHLLLRDDFTALIMTSANISDEPICFEDDDALRRLADIADYFLVHNRPIHIRSDDSVMRVFQGRPLFYRRARGYAPRGIKLPYAVPGLLAVGAELKGAVCLAHGQRAFLSQHIGDLQNSSTYDSFRHTITHLCGILEIKPTVVACDLHPDYLSSLFAEEYCSTTSSAPGYQRDAEEATKTDAGSRVPMTLYRVQHHHAHMASCMAENGLDGEVIGIIFDGTGYGSDGTVWGGEFLTGGYDGFRRAGHLHPLPLPGGDAAVREPWRMALAYLHQAMGKTAFSLDHPVARRMNDTEKDIFAAMLEKGINTSLTTSCGRLFDAVAALLNVRQVVSYDGQAAIELETLAETSNDSEKYEFEISLHSGGLFQLELAPVIKAIWTDLQTGVSSADIARRFHTTLAYASVDVCERIAEGSNIKQIVLSGGVFQNRLLSEMVYTGLTGRGLQVFTHRLVPPNDGGIALGQAAIAGRRIN
jgi:hydrogenase maturation protein HypF